MLVRQDLIFRHMFTYLCESDDESSGFLSVRNTSHRRYIRAVSRWCVYVYGFASCIWNKTPILFILRVTVSSLRSKYVQEVRAVQPYIMIRLFFYYSGVSWHTSKYSTYTMTTRIMVKENWAQLGKTHNHGQMPAVHTLRLRSTKVLVKATDLPTNPFVWSMEKNTSMSSTVASISTQGNFHGWLFWYMWLPWQPRKWTNVSTTNEIFT